LTVTPARHIHAGGALHESTADDDVFDFLGIELRALHGMTQYVRGKGHGMRHVERPAPGFCQPGPGGRNDDGVAHT
jgi:hypothetical protein